MNTRFVLICLCLGFAGCATTRPTIVLPEISYHREDIDHVKYKNIAVLPFADAPGSPYSGQVVAGSMGQALSEFGFSVVERARLQELLKEQWLSAAGVLDPTAAIQIGKILGVRALVMGEVGQYETHSRHTDTTYFPFVNYYTGETTYIPRQGQQWLESYVSMTTRIVDVESGALIFSGAISMPRGVTNPPQELATRQARDLIARWVVSPGRVGLQWDNNHVIIDVEAGTPARRAGIKVGDKILGINSKRVAGVSDFDLNGMLWGKPGEPITLNIDRNGAAHTFRIIRVPRPGF